VLHTALAGRWSTLTELIRGLQFPVLMMLATLQYLVMVAVLFAVLAGRASYRARLHSARLQVERARLQEQLAGARVEALTAQLHPHFLFNTLNSIAVLTGTDPAGARLMVHRLSGLLRAVLADRSDATTPLHREIALLESYLEIHRIRFGDRLRVRMVLDPRAADCAVPALLLQPLVENAIEHAVTHRENGGAIEISTRLDGDRLKVTVADDGPGCDPARRSQPGAGIGLNNTRERLRQIYGDGYAFTIAREAPEGCVVRIDIPAALP
jgi:LytS/YehU family sensor histidine kinase